MQTPRPVPHDPSANLVVYSAAFKPFCTALLAGFAKACPAVRLQFVDGVSTELHSQFLNLQSLGHAPPDVIWSSAMDLQMELVHQGHAQPHRSPHAPAMPAWARFQDLAFCTTLEPLVSLRHTRYLGSDVHVSTLAEVADVMAHQPSLLVNRLACLDIEANGMGFLAMLVARQAAGDFERFIRLAAPLNLRTHGSNPPLVQALVDEQAVLAFPVLGSFAARAVHMHPELAVCQSQAARLGLSRVALVPKGAPHPEQAACFVDFLLSPQGQACMREDGLFPISDRGQSPLLPAMTVQPLSIEDGFGPWLDPQARQALRQDWRRLALA
jgi:iron(III) transport system substrate-binding protein